MKNFNIFVMVMVLVVLMGLTGACKQVDVDPIEQDDAAFVRVEKVVTSHFDIFYVTTVTLVFNVKTSAPTRLEGQVRVGEWFTYLIGIDIPDTNGQWMEMKHAETDINFKAGTHSVSGYVNLLSINKRVDFTTSIVIP